MRNGVEEAVSGPFPALFPQQAQSKKLKKKIIIIIIFSLEMKKNYDFF